MLHDESRADEWKDNTNVNPSLFWDVTQLRLVVLVIDVSGQPIGSIFKDQAVVEELGILDRLR